MWREFSWKFHVISYHKSMIVWSKLTPNSIPCHLSRFDLFSMLEHDMDFGQVQVMEFPWNLLRKSWDFHRIRSHFRPNYRQKDMRKYKVSHFLQGTTFHFYVFFSKYDVWCVYVLQWGSWGEGWRQLKWELV